MPAGSCLHIARTRSVPAGSCLHAARTRSDSIGIASAPHAHGFRVVWLASAARAHAIRSGQHPVCDLQARYFRAQIASASATKPSGPVRIASAPRTPASLTVQNPSAPRAAPFPIEPEPVRSTCRRVFRPRMMGRDPAGVRPATARTARLPIWHGRGPPPVIASRRLPHFLHHDSHSGRLCSFGAGHRACTSTARLSRPGLVKDGFS